MDRFYGDIKILKKIAGMFFDNSSKMISKINHAIKSGDNEELEYASHALKGSIAHFGAHSAFETALQLVIMGRNGDLTHAKKASATLSKEVERLKSELTVFIEENLQRNSWLTFFINLKIFKWGTDYER